MSARTEADMIAAVLAHIQDEANDTIAGTIVTRLDALEIKAVTDNGDIPSGQRVIYRTARTYDDLFILAAPTHGVGADAPFVRSHEGLGLQG